MDSKNEFELDITMEAKSHYKLRSSLKKRKSRNPLGSLDITEVNADITLAPPLRRVSFAASNYVKPFIDDPEKNTIWDNTYEEEVNHTDSTKSDNTNHTNLSELKSQYQEITKVDVQKECVTTIYCDEGMEDMEVSCFDQTMINEEVRNILGESNLDTTPLISPNIDVKNATELSKETTFNMELTCQWKNNIIQSNVLLHKEVTKSKDYLLRNSTVRQEEDMSMTCCFGNAEYQENRLPADVALSSEMECGNRDEFLPNHGEMEFTCAFPSNILESVKQSGKTGYNYSAMTAKGANGDNKENVVTVYTGKEKVLLPNESGMEFTCAFSSNILERVNQLKGSENHSLTMTAGYTNVENKENLATVCANTETVFLPNESGMDFTCAFPNHILERVNQPKGTKDNSSAMTAERVYLEDKKNIVTVYDQSGMEFTCAFPSNILETVNQPKETRKNISTTTTGIANFENQENIATVYTKNEKVFFPNQSGMEFTCAFPSNILEINKPKGTESNSSTMTTGGINVEDKENIQTLYAKKENVILPDKSGIIFSLLDTINQSKEVANKPSMITVGDVNVEDEENIASVYVEKQNVFVPDESRMEFTCAFPNETLGQEKQSRQAENDSLGISVVSGNVQSTENILPGEMTECPQAIYYKKGKVFLPHQSEMEYTGLFFDKILDTTSRPKNSNCLETTDATRNVENKENILPTIIGNKEKVFFPHQNKIFDRDSYPVETQSSSLLQANVNESKIEISKFDTKQLPISNRSLREEQANLNELTRIDNEPTDNLKIIFPPLKNDKLRESQSLLRNDINSSNAYTKDIKNKSKCNLVPNKESLIDVCQNSMPLTDPTRGTILKNLKSVPSKLISVEPKVTTEIIKPVKVREFGNILIAVDGTDLSIDQNTDDRAKPVIDASRQGYGLKENTYTISVAHPEKNCMQINEDTFVRRRVNAGPISQIDDTDPQIDIISFNERGENMIHKSVCTDDAGTQYVDRASTTLNQNTFSVMNDKKTQTPNLKRIYVDTVSPEKTASTKQKLNTEICLSDSTRPKNSKISVRLPNKHEEFKENIIGNLVCIAENQIKKVSLNVGENKKNNYKETEGFIGEECTLIESMDASVLINSLSLLDEEHLGVSFSQNKTDEAVSKEDQNNIVKEPIQHLSTKAPVTKVIYSEPMKVKPFNKEFPSMQTSGINTFNFSSIASMEDTQQLIQATFSKPSFVKTDQFEKDKWHSGFLPEPNMMEISERNEINRTETVALQNETLKAESILKNIHKKLIRSEFQRFNYEEITNSIKTHQDIYEKMEKLLLAYKFPEIRTFSLQEKTKKMSLGNVSSEGNSSESMLEVLDCGDDNNCNKSMLMEPNRNLHEKIVNVCESSTNLLNIKYFEECSYIFSTVHECVLIYVYVHPEDGRVTEIKTESSLDDSMDILNHFLVKNILDKLKQSTLKSYLGPYYDVLSLLDHICLTVDEVMDFHSEFLSLQKFYPTLRIHSDYSISWEVLHNCPPIWWTIRLNMTSVTKINPGTIHVKSKWENLNEEHIKQILRNIDEGVDSLRSFICNVYKYFERTQLRFKVQQS